ncbi:FCD domain-containing protein [Microlunatus aurantiacus]|uniref:FCD domain-containing protein n=1 Tax=Microlunatus aurantiacus TaxID=446786 RepID=A0ABP7CIY2_9ACTN
MSDQRAWQVVLGRIESDLAAGVLKPGDHLAPERALATELGVGRSSVREAVRVLEVLGLVRTQTGSGPSSGAVITAAPSDGMSVLMRLQVAAQGFGVDDVVRTRLLLETAVVGELAALAGPDLAEADTLLAAMDDDGHTSAEFLALDAQFHLALAAAAGNQVVTATMAGLRTSIERYVLIGAARLSSWAPVATRLRAEHRSIVAAVRAHDADGARRHLHDHITGYYAQTFAPVPSSPDPTRPVPHPSKES